jgi:serine protease Do
MKQLIKSVSRARAVLLGGALIMTVASLGICSRLVMANDAPKITPVALNISDNPVPRDSATGTSFSPVVKRVAQSVVKVNISTKSKTVPVPGGGPDEIFRRFFGNQFGNQFGGTPGNGGMMRTPREFGLGSGVIVNKDGYILTNNHVVENADTIDVTLNDGREFKAKVVGRDPKTDIAVLKIDAKDLPALTIADSDKIEVGDLCLAIGNPFGIGQTVTMGIISAMGRGNVGVGTDYEDYIQTDAAINPGNSGGALVDAEGRLIGINTAILSRTGGYQGIGFAVPVNLARTVMDSLITSGKVVRGFVGVGIQDITPSLAEEFKLKDDKGALVGDVAPHGPAEKAGVQSGDVIVQFNHKPVVDTRHLRLQVAETAPGTTVPVKIIRDGHEKTLDITVKELADAEQVAKSGDSQDNSSDTLNGVAVQDLDAQSRSQLNLPPNLKGALVTQVDEDSPAYDKGLRAGDVIEEINRKPVKNADDAVKLTEHVKDKVTLLKVYRKSPDGKGGSHYVVVDESKAG